MGLEGSIGVDGSKGLEDSPLPCRAVLRGRGECPDVSRWVARLLWVSVHRARTDQDNSIEGSCICSLYPQVLPVTRWLEYVDSPADLYCELQAEQARGLCLSPAVRDHE